MVILGELRGADDEITAAATFSDGPLFGDPMTSAGGCDYYIAPSEAGVSAGTVTITGTLAGLTLLPSSTPPINYMPANPLPADLFEAGATLSISAAGATVPAFSGTVEAPAVIGSPILPASLSRANGPTITWNAGQADEMWLWILPIIGNTTHLVWCRMPDNGSYTVSAPAMALIPAAASNGLVFLFRANATPVTAGNWTVSLTATDAFGSDVIAIGP
jgi:hypothetical protein